MPISVIHNARKYPALSIVPIRPRRGCPASALKTYFIANIFRPGSFRQGHGYGKLPTQTTGNTIPQISNVWGLTVSSMRLLARNTWIIDLLLQYYREWIPYGRVSSIPCQSKSNTARYETVSRSRNTSSTPFQVLRKFT